MLRVDKNTIQVLPSEGGAGIQTALDAIVALGGGAVQLISGTYVCSSTITWNPDSDNVCLQGVGGETILDYQMTASFGMSLAYAIPSNINDKACNGTTKGDTQVVLTTASDASPFTAKMFVEIKGTDVDGLVWKDLNEVDVAGDGGTGIVVLKDTIKRTYTSVTIIGHSNGFNNKMKDFKVFHSTNEAAFAKIINQKNFLMENLVLDGNNSNTSKGFDISAYNSVVKNNNIRKYRTSGDTTAAGINILGGTHLLISGNVIDSCGLSTASHKSGINILELFDSIIENNRILNIQGTGIGTDSTATYIRDLVVSNNTVMNCTDAGIIASGGTTKFTGWSVTGNICNNNNNNGIFFNGLQRSSIVGNSCQDNTNDGGISLTVCNEIIISGNICKKNNGILVFGTSSKVAITGNSCSSNGSGSVGIYLANATEITISGNLLNDNTYGIQIDASVSDVIISGNTSRGNVTNALIINNSSDNILSTGNNYRGESLSLGSGSNVQSISDMV